MRGPVESVGNRWHAVSAAVIIVGYLVAFAGDGLFSYFTPDDMMNLYGAWFRPLAEADRPLGALFYRWVFAVFGLHPMPYRIGCLLLLLINLGLLYVLCRKLSGSSEIGALACLLGAYHAHLADLYYSTGTVYDLLCGALYLSALIYYIDIRHPGELTWRQQGVLLAMYIAALGAKEMAVTLPAIVLVYELLYHRPFRALAALRRLAPVALVTVLFVLYKIAGTARMLDNPDYRPHFTWQAFTASWQHYCFDLFYGVAAFGTGRVLLLWALLIVIAALLRRRELIFAAAFLFVGILPVAFLTPRGFFAIYLTLPGWYLFGASALVATRHAIAAKLHLREPVTRVALFAGVALVLLPLHLHQKPIGSRWVAPAHAAVRCVAERLKEIAGPLPRGAKVLFLADPYPKDEWLLTFIFRLYYRDEAIRVDRVRAMRVFPDAVAQAEYDRLFVTDGRTLTVLQRP